MRVLVTNDDGIDSPGLAALAGVARERGHDTLVAAPSWDASGSSAAIAGLFPASGRPLGGVEARQWAGWPSGSVLGVHAPPAGICRSAMNGAFGPPPDLVLSGINRGANTGHAILRSGTVGAALVAYQLGRPAIAVSLDLSATQREVGASVDGDEAVEAHWATAASVAEAVFDWLVESGRVVAINGNVPDVPLARLRGIRAARLALGEAESDARLLAEGFASVTAVVPILEDPTVDLAGLFDPWKADL